MKLLSFIMLLFIAVCGIAQEKTISGTVVDKTNMPLPGATIVIKGTTSGASTDFDGLYSIKANVGDILVFSYVGYADQENTVGSSSIINISLALDNSLECVVVTALGTSRKQTRRQKKKNYHQSISNALIGQTHGILLSNERVVKKKAMNMDKLPLYIIDGEVIPKEYLSHVLKMDASIIKKTVKYNSQKSLRKFGESAKNGALIITTHNGSYRVQNDESYSEFQENNFESTHLSPLSTFSIDVDKASYANVRRMINNGQKVHPDAVKVEEFINYFEYNYPQPINEHSFSITTEVNPTSWNKQTKLVRIGLQGKTIAQEDLPASNLVFLIDVSGSMGGTNKLGLLKKAFKFLTNQLRKKDTVSIVVYAGAAGVVLEPTSGSSKQKIMEALNKLESGGSTAGGEGIELAYKIAQDNFVIKGNNRIILATDGDFNVGASSDKAMEKLIEEKRKSGVFLTCLGFGYGNYKDSKLETLADKGNGNHGYIDNMQEAQKMFGKEFGGTLYTIAKDVKIQLEFNPTIVEAYRLVGYENRLLNDEDFIDDTKDAGELGSGHTVTALYEIILKGTDNDYLRAIPDLKYTKTASSNSFSKELLTVKFRYKKPDGKKSFEIIQTVDNKNMIHNINDFNFSTAVALFGMQLRNSKYTSKTGCNDVIALAEKAKGDDKDGYRSEFIRLVKTLQ